MAQPIPGAVYTIQAGDSLASIAQQAYGNESLWEEIYIANKQVIGNNPNFISPGMQLYLLTNPQQAQVYLTTQSCTVTLANLNIRARPTTKSSIITSSAQGTVLNFIEIIKGESVNGNPSWGRSTQGHYFWMGGTNRQQG